MGTWEFERGDEVLRIVPDGPLLSSSIDLQLAGAMAGGGIIYTFEEYLRLQLDAGVLMPVLEEWWQAFSGPYLYYPSRRHMPSPLPPSSTICALSAAEGRPGADCPMGRTARSQLFV
ncbi:hypothetical protein GCM10011491_14380 [Brucella endophytica]|uniref:LysR substrate-binding domain-containing protein n=1 Tax=Brucella endophytica TaxID=1963359 RepID=A0A916S7T7_9HYPH|nr:hypothetical protein [Brucella endophytica]GGA87770.1 hypothetical protein GCM10011491_14380 [Brucella endophytica]